MCTSDDLSTKNTRFILIRTSKPYDLVVVFFMLEMSNPLLTMDDGGSTMLLIDPFVSNLFYVQEPMPHDESTNY